MRTSPATLSTRVLVVGGGPAGSAAALALARRGVPVLLLERTPDHGPLRIGETLPPHACRSLQSLGVWETFLQEGHLPASGVTALWGTETPHENDFLFSPYGCGWHLERVRFDAMLTREAERAGATVLREARLETCRTEGSSGVHALARLPDGPATIHSDFVVDATGRAAVVLRALGAGRHVYDRLVGLAAFGSLEAGASSPVPSARTGIEAMDDGWWYSATLPDNRWAACFMTDADLVAPADRSRLWNDALQRSCLTRARLALRATDTVPHVASAGTYLASPIVGSCWAAVGDAAAAWDPLSSQGICKALDGGLAVAEAIAAHLDGSPSALAAYADRIRQEFSDYLTHRAYYYALEAARRQTTFWRRRSLSTEINSDRGGYGSD